MNADCKVAITGLDLRLPLETKWFEMTKAGIKTEDYRSITPYWFGRLFADSNKSKSHQEEACNNLKNKESVTLYNFQRGCYNKLKPFDYNIMTLGYPKSTDTERILKIEHKGIEVRAGNPEWGAEPNKIYFVIKHGNIL